MSVMSTWFFSTHSTRLAALWVIIKGFLSRCAWWLLSGEEPWCEKNPWSRTLLGEKNPPCQIGTVAFLWWGASVETRGVLSRSAWRLLSGEEPQWEQEASFPDTRGSFSVVRSLVRKERHPSRIGMELFSSENTWRKTPFHKTSMTRMIEKSASLKKTADFFDMDLAQIMLSK